LTVQDNHFHLSGVRIYPSLPAYIKALHRHSDFEIFFMPEATLTVHTAEKDHLFSDSLVILPPSLSHHVSYEPNTDAVSFPDRLRDARDRDCYLKQTTTGPHRDDFSFLNADIDLRKFGSQGQQRTCALSLKLSEIEIVRQLTGDRPVLMLDDVLSELDSRRQNYLLDTIGDIQTFITCTGLDEFVNHRFAIDTLYRIEAGKVSRMSGPAVP
jgi:recombinational DNA repair ATPase RecF